MPEPIKRNERYMPGLDGLRAIAVLAVIAYHLKIKAMPGGLLGVGVFFTLSGYLITDILLNQAATGGVRLKSFWLARARRLLPALFVMLIVVMAWVTVIGPHQPGDFRTAAATASVYVNNWWLIFHHVSYFAAFAAPEPLNHLWSLSVEEQFYILWPFLIILGTRLLPEGSSVTRPRLARATILLAIASGILMALLYRRGLDPSRVYYGTDTRALELLAGAALAMVWPSRHIRRDITPQAKRTIEIAGVVGLLILALMFWRTDEYSPFLYHGGFAILSLATVLVIASLVHPASRLGDVVGGRLLRWIGVRSYGIYLWHFPIVILTTPSGAHGFAPVRAFLQVAATFAIAALSWRYLEDPIRHGALGRLRKQLAAGRAPREGAPMRRRVAGAAIAALLVAALAGFAGVGARPKENEPGTVTVSQTVTSVAVPPTSHSTSCRTLVHIGDSTSEGLVSPQYLPNPKKRISARYAKIGVRKVHLEISGARSIYERYQGQPNAEDIAKSWQAKHFDGCWVLALGTNEAANVAAGSKIGLDRRIDIMMSAARNEPVLWVNVKSLRTDGPYAEANMLLWDAALTRACARHPNMRVYDWASEVQDEWFIPDGIHFTTPGYAARGRLIAKALATAFPARGRPPATCLVHAAPAGATGAAPSTATQPAPGRSGPTA